MTDRVSIGDIRAAFNAGYCYGTEEDASPEDLNCAWDIYQKRPDAVPDDWQPIKSAPLNERLCLRGIKMFGDADVVIVFGRIASHDRPYESKGVDGCRFTHWRPEPVDPETEVATDDTEVCC